MLITTFVLFLCLYSASSSSVVQLTESNFDEYVGRFELVFINFYADWCRFSKLLEPIFADAYQKVLKDLNHENRVVFGKVDCDVENQLASRFRVTKYPTLKLIMNGKLLRREYRKTRDLESLFSYIQDQLQDPVKKLSTHPKVSEGKPAVVGFFQQIYTSSPEYLNFRKVASELKDDCAFYWITGEVPTTVPVNTVYFASVGSNSETVETKDIYPGDSRNDKAINRWISSKCVPLVREITFENAEELTEEGLPFVINFYSPDDLESIKLFTRVVETELTEFHNSTKFLTANGYKFKHPLQHLGKTTKDLPLIAIDSFRHMYLFPNYDDVRKGKLWQFIADLHSGKLHREFHHGPDPTPAMDVGKPAISTQPPESSFVKLAPSSNRYTLLRDEL